VQPWLVCHRESMVRTISALSYQPMAKLEMCRNRA
jgi:hypothetical protein